MSRQSYSSPPHLMSCSGFCTRDHRHTALCFFSAPRSSLAIWARADGGRRVRRERGRLTWRRPCPEMMLLGYRRQRRFRSVICRELRLPFFCGRAELWLKKRETRTWSQPPLCKRPGTVSEVHTSGTVYHPLAREISAAPPQKAIPRHQTVHLAPSSAGEVL
jgi:hypothetical protein